MTTSVSLTIQSASRLPNIPSTAKFKQWVNAALQHDAEITVRIVNAAEARKLNRDFRGKDYATNVLTFVYHEKNSKKLSGDIVLCAPVIAREAKQQMKPLTAHYAHLTIHGVLHLSGMDHENDHDAKKMESREIKILRELGFNDPYVAIED
jgi:probable rRNA maturation factor